MPETLKDANITLIPRESGTRFHFSKKLQINNTLKKDYKSFTVVLSENNFART